MIPRTPNSTHTDTHLPYSRLFVSRCDRFNEPFSIAPLDATLLRRTASVVRDGRHVDDVGDLVADVVKRTHGRFAARARALDPHFQRLHAVVERDLAGLLGRDLGRERARLAGTAENRTGRGRPRTGV